MSEKSFDKELLKAIKSLGLIDYDLRKKLSRGQKSRVTKLAQEYKQVLSRPNSFHIATVSKARAKELKDSGFKVTAKNKAIIPLKGYESASIEKGRIKFHGDGITDTTYLGGASGFYEQAMALRKRPLKNNEYLTLRIGDNGPFNVRFTNWADLVNYVNNVFKPKDQSKQKILGYISIVRVHEETDWEDEEE